MSTSETAVYAISHLTAAPGKEAELLSWLQRAGAASRVQTGCVSWTAYADTHNASRFAVVAHFSDEAAYHSRLTSEWWTDIISELPDITTGELQHEVYRVAV